MQQELDSMRKALVLRNYATRTVDTYVSLLRRYLEQLKKPIDDVTPTDIQEWQMSLVDRKVSWSLFNQARKSAPHSITASGVFSKCIVSCSSLCRRASSTRFCFDTSVLVPNHCRTRPCSSLSGITRVRNGRKTPSAPRNGKIMSKGSPVAVKAAGDGVAPVHVPFAGNVGGFGGLPLRIHQGGIRLHGLLEIRDERRLFVLHVHQPRRVLRDLLGDGGHRRDVLARKAVPASRPSSRRAPSHP